MPEAKQIPLCLLVFGKQQLPYNLGNDSFSGSASGKQTKAAVMMKPSNAPTPGQAQRVLGGLWWFRSCSVDAVYGCHSLLPNVLKTNDVN